MACSAFLTVFKAPISAFFGSQNPTFTPNHKFSGKIQLQEEARSLVAFSYKALNWAKTSQCYILLRNSVHGPQFSRGPFTKSLFRSFRPHTYWLTNWVPPPRENAGKLTTGIQDVPKYIGLGGYFYRIPYEKHIGWRQAYWRIQTKNGNKESQNNSNFISYDVAHSFLLRRYIGNSHWLSGYFSIFCFIHFKQAWLVYFQSPKSQKNKKMYWKYL